MQQGNGAQSEGPYCSEPGLLHPSQTEWAVLNDGRDVSGDIASNTGVSSRKARLRNPAPGVRVLHVWSQPSQMAAHAQLPRKALSSSTSKLTQA